MTQMTSGPRLQWLCPLLSLVCALTWSVAAKEEYWPRLLANEVDFTRLTNYVGAIPLATSVLAFIVLWIRRRSVLDLWLAAAIFATVIEQAVLCLFIFNRYSVGAYAVRTFSVIVSTIVLSAMLSETVRVYASLARTNKMLRRERENKLTNLAAVVAAITHELRQPLTGISTKSAAKNRPRLIEHKHYLVTWQAPAFASMKCLRASAHFFGAQTLSKSQSM